MPKLEHKVRRSTSHEYFNQWFSVEVNSEYPFKKRDEEVDEIRWFTKEEMLKFFNENPSMFVPSFILTLNHFLKNEN